MTSQMVYCVFFTIPCLNRDEKNTNYPKDEGFLHIRSLFLYALHHSPSPFIASELPTVIFQDVTAEHPRQYEHPRIQNPVCPYHPLFVEKPSITPSACTLISFDRTIHWLSAAACQPLHGGIKCIRCQTSKAAASDYCNRLQHGQIYSYTSWIVEQYTARVRLQCFRAKSNVSDKHFSNRPNARFVL